MATNVANQAATASLTETKLYVSVVTHGNAKLGEKLKSGFKIAINWDRYQLKIWTKRPNQYLDYLTASSFSEENRILFYHLNIMHNK